MTPDRSVSRAGAVPDGDRLANLQVLRALAALSVVLGHTLHETGALGAPARFVAAAQRLNLGFGVDIFFVISGFIMLHTSLGQFGREGASYKFLSRRIARIAPIYWLLTTVMILGSLAAPGLLNVAIGDVGHVAASYLFIPDMRGVGEIRPVMALGWTLNYEMMFYVLFALALCAPARVGVVWLAAVMILLVVGGLYAAPEDVRLKFWTSPLILEFLFGVFVALLRRRGLRLSLYAALLLAGYGLVGYAFRDDPAGGHDGMRALCAGLPAACLVLALTSGPFAGLARYAPGLVALGDASYSLYLVHPFVIRPLRVIWAKTALSPTLYVAAAFALSALVALALYRWVELPLTGAARRALTPAPKSNMPARMAFAMRREA
jgi:peptidoglycan/LPS O-acetylase OafA/YrhL